MLSITRSRFLSFYSGRDGTLRVEMRRSFAIVCCLLLTSTAAFSQTFSQQQPPVLNVQTEVVNVYAVVTDKHGRVIPNLTRKDFELTDNGAPQQIQYFSRAADTPLTLGIMIDTSPSQQRVLPIEQEQAKWFLQEVMRAKDLAFVLHFDLAVELLQDFTPSLSRLDRAIDETEINGGAQGPLPSTFPSAQEGYTHLYDAIWLACSPQLMAQQTGRKVLILLTDGQDEGSKETLGAAVRAAQKADVMVYSMDVMDRAMYGSYSVYGGGYIGDSVLKKISEQTGGEFIRVKRREDMSAAFQEIARQLRTQYLLGFSPANRERDGSYHKLRVRTVDEHYRVEARQGYYASSH